MALRQLKREVVSDFISSPSAFELIREPHELSGSFACELRDFRLPTGRRRASVVAAWRHARAPNGVSGYAERYSNLVQ